MQRADLNAMAPNQFPQPGQGTSGQVRSPTPPSMWPARCHILPLQVHDALCCLPQGCHAFSRRWGNLQQGLPCDAVWLVRFARSAIGPACASGSLLVRMKRGLHASQASACQINLANYGKQGLCVHDAGWFLMARALRRLLKMCLPAALHAG